jgi:exonuclease VII small subunit
MALAQQDVNGAIAELEDNRARIQEKADSGGFDDATIISMRPANMSSGQALKNKDSIIQNYLQTSNAEIDQAIDMLRRGVGQPRAMQGNLFSTQQRVNTLEAEKTRLTRILDTARAELKRMQD